MGNVKIKDIFQKDITRKINGVVKADQNTNDIIVTELSEYVVTEELRKHFDKFFDRYVRSLSSPTEDMGVWISGFYGSGKSHFLKMIGRILENKIYDGKKVTEYFQDKIKDGILQGNIEKSSEVPTDVILFNVDNVSDQDTYQNKDSIAVAFLKNFNGYFGFSKDNLKIASFERMLWEKGILEEFKEKIEKLLRKDWKDILRNLDFYQDDFIEVNEEMGIMSGESTERWLEKDDKIPVSPESFADLLEAYLKTKDPNHRIVFLVDEIGQYIGNNSQLMLNLQTLVEILGVRFQGRVWVIVTSQQDLGNILGEGEHRKNDFSKIQDRFKTMLSLSSSNIDEVIKKRLLEKKSIDKENIEKLYEKNYVSSKIQDRFKTMLSLSSSNIDEVIKKRLLEKKSIDKENIEKLYEKNYVSISNTINFGKNNANLPVYNGKFDFAETYPFVGYQFSLLQKVFEKVRDMGYSGQHMSRGERSLLSSFQEAGIRIKEKEVGSLVPFNYFFESIEQFLEDIAKRPFFIAKNERGIDEFELEVLKLLFLLKGIKDVKSNIDNIVFLEDIAKRPFFIAKNERGIDEFELEVLKLLFLLKGIKDVKSNIDNIVSFMIDSIDCDRLDLENNIKKALLKLEQQVLIQKAGDEYEFLTNEEQDINKEIKQEEINEEDIYKQLDSYIFGEIFTKNSVYSDETKMKYTFSKRIDEINISKRGEQLDINILTPRADGYNQIPLLGTREGYDLIMRLPADDISYIDEIKLYLKVENYVKRRNIENTRESITSILSGKQSENNHRRKRIKAGIERAILGADIFVYGQKREIGSISDAGKVIENSLKLGADFRFSKAKLLKNPYDESRIKNVLSNSFEGGNILFSINRDLENNQNREAIKEVQKRIELLEKMGKTITLKDLADHFMKAPYGWNVFSVNGLVAELWVYKIIELSESKEIIGDSVRLKEYLTKSQTRNLERIVVNLKEEVDTELIKKVNNTLKELFGSSDSVRLKEYLTKSQTRNLERIVVNLKEEVDTELIKKVNNTLKELFGSSIGFDTDSPKGSLIEVLEKRKNISNLHLRECINGKYPGKKELEEWIELLDDIILQKNKKTEKFLQEFLKEQDEFYDLYYQQSDAEDFFNAGSSKKIKFDSARDKIREIRENLGYMGAIQETDPYKELLKITDDKKPYSRIREIDDLLNKIEAEEKKIIEHEKNILKDKAEKERERLKRILNNKEFSFDEIQKEFEKFILEIEKANTIKKIMSDNKELENIIRK